ncbi:hypothetical protein [uncultured Desulfobacter sp.]|uniref:hypothetical protein n=1 Tax=uncultured Desulfobacter sp. TaxID=240139 RepID=UPI0029C95D34|nr:hypothetical protein [uncultured Desulfobacter sp.]
MIMISPNVAEELPPGSNHAEYGKEFGIIHFDEVGGFGHQPGAENLEHNPLKKAYSDHWPLWMRFRTNGEHYDGTWD